MKIIKEFLPYLKLHLTRDDFYTGAHQVFLPMSSELRELSCCTMPQAIVPGSGFVTEVLDQ